MNNEVFRLRRLRQSALRVRALGLVLGGGGRADAVFLQGALLTWRIARIATGSLRSHPYESYRQDPGIFERLARRVNAILVAVKVGLRGGAAEVYLAELRAVARELDDTRALTLSADLSDALGRAQEGMRGIIFAVQKEVSLDPVPASRVRLADQSRASRRFANSSYLAL